MARKVIPGYPGIQTKEGKLRGIGNNEITSPLIANVKLLKLEILYL
jgi:hypothetical protein